MDKDRIIIGNMELVSYKGVYSLVAVREWQGKYYQKWGRMEFGKDRTMAEKSEPFKVILGDKEEAEKVLVEIMNAIGEQS